MKTIKKEIRVLCIHGVGNHDLLSKAEVKRWQTDWKKGIAQAINAHNPAAVVKCEFLKYDDAFDKAGFSLLGITEAALKLLYSGVYHGIGDLFGRPRGLLDFPEQVRWQAGMVVQWVENEELQKKTRSLLRNHVKQFKPDVIFAHSLGSLIAYDALGRDKGIPGSSNITFISAGSQIGNPFVRESFVAGRINPLPVRFWYHLYNEEDMVLTCPITLEADNFRQIDTPFDIEGMLDHDALCYIKEGREAWRDVAAPSPAKGIAPAAIISRGLFARKVAEKRALLVGINEYPNPANRLEGCLNDVFLMSSVLQELGFPADSIRVVFNERASAAGIKERMAWLLDGCGDGASRVFYYSGHGAQIPAYGADETVDRLDECLVPYDFDWTRENAITDNDIYELYSQLPYEASVSMFFDCCHSGGIARDGALRIKGMNPPDDIRHRLLRWDSEHEMWVPRELSAVNKDFKKWPNGAVFAGSNGNVLRLGTAGRLRKVGDPEYDATRKSFGHKGPYLPMIFHACGEAESAYEYRHGLTSYGAFTFVAAKILRSSGKAGKPLTFQHLVDAAGKEISDLGYAQKPSLLGPRAITNSTIPWHTGK